MGRTVSGGVSRHVTAFADVAKKMNKTVSMLLISTMKFLINTYSVFKLLYRGYVCRGQNFVILSKKFILLSRDLLFHRGNEFPVTKISQI